MAGSCLPLQASRWPSACKTVQAVQAYPPEGACMSDKNKEITGKAKGGIARAEALSAEERRSIAVKAAAARWGDKPPKATHRGNFKEEFGIDVECYVLDDEQKTAVISKRGMSAAIGLSP